MMTERDRINSINYARQEGREEGERKGREEGLMEGERKGREEERLSIAKSLLSAGVPAETVAKATGLSLETVRDLADKLTNRH